MSDKKIVIAIDGFSSSGKSTLAKSLARAVGYIYVDSGAMYRAVTLYALQHGMIAPDGTLDRAALIKALPLIDITFRHVEGDANAHTFLNGEDVERPIRDMEVANHVSEVAAIPEVRSDLVAKQRAMGRDKGIVMDGRDIGTTVFPHAELKIFLNASPEQRAERRRKELAQKGREVSYEDVYRNIVERDHIDSTRADSPLRKADDAIEIDNGAMTLAQQDEMVLSLFKKVTGH